MPDNPPDLPAQTEQTEQTVLEAFDAFRRTMEARGAAFRVTVRRFDPRAEATLTYEASLWADIEQEH